MTLAEINDELGAARTNKKEFLEKLETIIPWETFFELIQPSCYKGELGNKPYPLELMLRIFILQNVYNLADMAVMNEVIDSRAFSNFCGINSPSEVPNGDTRCRFINFFLVCVLIFCFTIFVHFTFRSFQIFKILSNFTYCCIFYYIHKMKFLYLFLSSAIIFSP